MWLSLKVYQSRKGIAHGDTEPILHIERAAVSLDGILAAVDGSFYIEVLEENGKRVLVNCWLSELRELIKDPDA